MSTETTYHISRHLRSCNNIIDDKELSIFKKFSEPGLSFWGTITGLGLDRTIEGTFNNKVYVSCLVRTWMTAIVQYLPYCSNNKLVLVVSPYIKEKHVKMLKQADIGNLPVPFSEQVNKIQRFYDFLTLIRSFLNNNYPELSNSQVTTTIKQRLDKILTESTEIEIRFPKINVNEEKTFILKYTNKRLNLITPIDKRFNPYSTIIPRVNNFYLMKGGASVFNFGQKQADYMKNNMVMFIKQKQRKIKVNDVVFNNTELSINSVDTMKKGLFFKTQPQINVYTDYFEKEGMFLFMDWVKNSIKDVNVDIYVVAHSNIMQATLVNICQLLKNNPLIDKKTLDACHPAFSVIKHQNIWEMVLKTESSMNGLMRLKSMVVREGEDPPNDESTNAIDLNQELSCFSKEIRMDNEPIPIKNNYFGKTVSSSVNNITKRLIPSKTFFSRSEVPPIRSYANGGGKKKKTKRRTQRNKNTRKRRS
jgi:hypothetical protein